MSAVRSVLVFNVCWMAMPGTVSGAPHGCTSCNGQEFILEEHSFEPIFPFSLLECIWKFGSYWGLDMAAEGKISCIGFWCH